MEPFNWNVVVRASWNLAILTPRGIAQRLLGLPVGTPVEVRVPLDGRNPFQVHHDGLVIVASDDQLIIEPDQSEFQALELAMHTAARAIDQLPETPCTAAGFNLRYKMDTVPDTLLDLVRCELDDRLAEAGHLLTARKRAASWQYRDGAINLELVLEGAHGLIQLNFHRSSTNVASLRQWLEMPRVEIEQATERALTSLGLLHQATEHRDGQ